MAFKTILKDHISKKSVKKEAYQLKAANQDFSLKLL